jgi:hypothetical protein
MPNIKRSLSTWVREMSIVYDHVGDTAGPLLERSGVDTLKWERLYEP